MESQAVPDGIYPAASTVHANVSIGVFTEYGILYGSDFDSAEFRIIPRNTDLLNSAEFRALFL